MAVPINHVPPLTPARSTPAALPSADGKGSGFSDVFANLLNDVNQPQVAADQSLQQLVKGETDNVHDVVLSMAKADLAFRFVLEIRNRLVESYQEIVRMQV